MKNNIKRCLFIIVIIFVVSISTTVNASDEVTTRDLAILASLVYEPAPDVALYDGVDPSDPTSCVFDENNQIRKKTACNFSYPETFVKWKGKKYQVQKYIEGLSERKRNWFSVITTAHVEDGMLYYFFDFVNPNELVSEKSKWTIDHVSGRPVPTEKVGKSGQFYAITFKRGNNYVIAYRGTDYPDVSEWLQDLKYTLGSHEQAEQAYKYAQAEYNRIMSENKNAEVNIYTTGHSLGAYLAQIGGAAIIDLGKKDADRNTTDPTKIVVNDSKLTSQLNLGENDYKNIYTYQKINNKLYTSYFKGVFYFNGMGISAIGLNAVSYTSSYSAKNFNSDIANALVYLSMFNANGSIANGDRTLNYSDTAKSSGRLVLYSMNGDPVSGVGLHYGEIIKLQAAADTIANHQGKHILPKALSKGNAIVVNGITSIVQQIKNFFKNIIVQFNISQNEAEVKYGELASESILSFASGMGVLSSAEYKGDDMPHITEEAIKAKNNLMKKFHLMPVVNFISALKSTANSYDTGSLIETINIGHETDSFTCLLDNKKGDELGVPTLEIVSDNNTDEDQEAQHTIYVNGKDKITLKADVANGCVKKYIWVRVSGDKEEVVKGNNETTKDYYENYFDITKNYMSKKSDGTVEIYKVYAYYGDTFEDWKLNASEDDYSYDIVNKRGNANRYVTASYKVIYDKTAPSCSFSPSYVTIKQGDSSTVTLKCNDASSINLIESNIKLADTIFDPRLVITSKNCDSDSKKCTIKIKAEKVLISLARKKMDLSYSGKITDSAGNSTSVSNATVEWVRK